MRRSRYAIPSVLLVLSCFAGQNLTAAAETGAAPQLAWPVETNTMRPWTYWWWPGSAVDPTNLTRELQRYRDAGLGGVHIIPIYGAKGWEDKYIEYLSPKWMDMLRFTVTEAQRLGLGVDMTTGTGWCFGGPQVSDNDANANVVVKTYGLGVGERLNEKFDRKTTQALVAFGPEGKTIDLTDSISTNGEVFFSPPGNWQGTNATPPKTWTIYAISQKPSGQKVKRAAPGGEGWMLNLIYSSAMDRFLQPFTAAFAGYTGPKPRAQYHDSYEYKSDWSPDFFAQFEKRRGYKLQTELPALFGTNTDDHAARVKCDYRQTVSEIMAEESLPKWVKWSHDRGFITRDQAHGSPGNWLDLYAAADIPETEMFHTDRNKLISKFASSAAHVTGKPLVSAETGTWLEEHFTETLGDLKFLADDMFLSGVNHIFYHGCCYSPDEAGWPGWLFYASTEMNPRNSIWRDVPTLNAYITRCQSVLQSGKPDNDILLYWPICDLWHEPTGRLQHLKVEAPRWFENQAIGKTAKKLWDRGFTFDYVSDRQLASAKVVNGKIEMPGGSYRVVAVPSCEHMPLETFKKLLVLADSGATVIFENHLPTDVPGWGDLEKQREQFKALVERVPIEISGLNVSATKIGKGRVLVGALEVALARAGVERETMADHPGLLFIRRATESGRHYFIANQGDQALDGWVTLATKASSVMLMDAMTGRVGIGPVRRQGEGKTQVYLQLQPGESAIVRTIGAALVDAQAWPYLKVAGDPVEIAGNWQVKFIASGPELPGAFETNRLASWTDLSDTNAQRFAGTALYAITFDAPAQAADVWLLGLGKVCDSARLRLNGRELGALITSPFRVAAEGLKPKDNLLEVKVTNLSANRIRDLDRRGVPWKIFHDINFVNVNYRPFDASNWPLRDSGLLGPVRLLPAKQINPARN